MDVIGEKGRVLVKGISLNTFHYLKGNDIKNDKKNSEESDPTLCLETDINVDTYAKSE